MIVGALQDWPQVLVLKSATIRTSSVRTNLSEAKKASFAKARKWSNRNTWSSVNGPSMDAVKNFPKTINFFAAA